MKKNDKIIAILGVAILIIATVGVYLWAPKTTSVPAITANRFVSITGNLKEMPDAITVDDSCPFYPLIVTPLAINYDAKGEQSVIPLYVANSTNPSSAVTNAMGFLDLGFGLKEVAFDGSRSAKEESLWLAENYWDSADAAIIIENNQHGYELGVMATPIASYLRIPVIVTDTIDENVTNVLNKLGVKYTMICGDDIDGYGSVLRFNSVEEIFNATMEILNGKFGAVDSKYRIDYVTLTNPIDAWPPKVLDEPKVFYLEPKEIKSNSPLRGSTIKNLVHMLVSDKAKWEFTIPKDYKYALIQFEGYNNNIEGVEEFDDSASFTITPEDAKYDLSGGGATFQGVPVRDDKGNIIQDVNRNDFVLYDCGGQKFSVTATGSWALSDKGTVSAKVTVTKLESALYPSMKSLSSIAPYITSYHRGIMYGKPEFAFAAGDDRITDDGKTCPGYYMPGGRNPDLIPLLTKHLYDNVHEPLNQMLAELAGIPYHGKSDLKALTEYYRNNPVYIALVGDAVGLPQLLYKNDVETFSDATMFGGGGTDSENLYADIDPVAYDYNNMEKDVYSQYPYLENIVGRIAGWDVQDADALVVRTIFYDKIINQMSQWKETFGVLNGDGLDFRMPLATQVINHIPIVKQILNVLNKVSSGYVNFVVGPWKLDTGFSKIIAMAIENEMGKELGFTNTKTALGSYAMIDGFSDEALNQIKHINLYRKLTFPVSQIKGLAGEGAVEGRNILQNSNFIYLSGHGCPFNFGMAGPTLEASAFDGFILNAPKLWQKIWKNLVPYLLIGFMGPGQGLDKIGEYSPRKVTTVNFGPSFVWLESCFCGRINGITPTASISQAFLHSGVTALIASPTSSNIPGGYLEPKKHMWDSIISTKTALKKAEKNAQQGIFPDFHFGLKIYHDLCINLKNDGVSIGRALRDAKNVYLPEDADSNFWWNPPLGASGGEASAGYGTQLVSKYTSFNEYMLFGDPAFSPYEPCNEGGVSN